MGNRRPAPQFSECSENVIGCAAKKRHERRDAQFTQVGVDVLAMAPGLCFL